MQHPQYDTNITFLQQKGFDASSLTGLKKALTWLKDTDADCLMHGEGSGDPFDIMVGEMRRPMLISSVEAAMAKLQSKHITHPD